MLIIISAMDYSQPPLGNLADVTDVMLTESLNLPIGSDLAY
jgi:hypothetical protein